MKKYVLTGIKVICTLAFMHGLVLNAKGQSKSSMSSDCISGNCFCIQGSLDFANVNYSSSGSSISYKSRTGFNLGVFVFHPFPTNMKAGSLLLKGGLEFIQKGYSYNSGGSKETLTLGYLEIPIDILYQYPLANCNSIYGGLGPYFAYGLGGKDKYSYAGQTVSGNSFSDSTAKRFDAGL
ncbi:MAG TPA: outer membrane beta-barrel protein, partial [Puia sp.]|nr:outer membrane beta-barrel protein [Puia sp.]